MTPVFINRSSKPLPRAFLIRWLKRVERKLPFVKDRKAVKGKELVIVFLDSSEARRLNREHRGRDYATDVLSFEPLEAGSLGELILCPQVIAQQARTHRIPFNHELAYLVLHGVLHLLGYEHENKPKQAQRMFAIQDAIFEEIDRL